MGNTNTLRQGKGRGRKAARPTRGGSHRVGEQNHATLVRSAMEHACLTYLEVPQPSPSSPPHPTILPPHSHPHATHHARTTHHQRSSQHTHAPPPPHLSFSLSLSSPSSSTPSIHTSHTIFSTSLPLIKGGGSRGAGQGCHITIITTITTSLLPWGRGASLSLSRLPKRRGVLVEFAWFCAANTFFKEHNEWTEIAAGQHTSPMLFTF